MRTFLTTSTLLAAGALLGWLAASDRVSDRLRAQDKPSEKARPGDTSSRWDELAKLPFPNGYPTEEARSALMDEFLSNGPCRSTSGRCPR
jgi:hypothetical protein